MTILGREAEVDALVTDAYLEALLAGRPVELPDPKTPRDAVDAAVRMASARLTRDLPRFHPSFRFEERLALRLAEAAATLRLPTVAGGEADPVPIPLRPPGSPDPLTTLRLLGEDGEDGDDGEDGEDGEDGDFIPRPLLIRGAMAASAISLAGAAWVAWRRNRTASSRMARAIRAAHARRTT
ncbi:MAG: hypothetical protein L0221_17575 [Chloroflexi bacterium]|nr:hypothetical protein [Chloroflexota bacterium]